MDQLGPKGPHLDRALDSRRSCPAAAMRERPRPGSQSRSTWPPQALCKLAPLVLDGTRPVVPQCRACVAAPHPAM
eukprot:6038984-Pyramimonas_sp.AAC.1